MTDPTDMGHLESLALLAPTSPDLQRKRLLMILRAVPALVAAHLSPSQRLLMGGVVNQGVQRMAAQVAQMSDDETTCLLRFLTLTLRDVNDSELADADFAEHFTTEYERLDALFTHGGAA